MHLRCMHHDILGSIWGWLGHPLVYCGFSIRVLVPVALYCPPYAQYSSGLPHTVNMVAHYLSIAKEMILQQPKMGNDEAAMKKAIKT
mmetsp:Transcript_29731/g.53392  ORF Transcript_29731/g.53392 Transcript_29731/m.53392 type:complete len:87 (+) Transcript_29731:109-369(+)